MKALVSSKVLKKPLSKSRRAKLKIAPFGPAIILRLSAALSLADRVREFVCVCALKGMSAELGKESARVGRKRASDCRVMAFSHSLVLVGRSGKSREELKRRNRSS